MFSRRSGKRTGYLSHCKRCAQDYLNAYRKSNAERTRYNTNRWRKDHLEIISEKSKRRVREMPTSYIATVLGVRVNQLTQELITLKREQLEITRMSRQIKNALKEANEAI